MTALTVVCCRVADLDEPAPGAITSTCVRCHEPVWLDLTTATATARANGYAVVNVTCMQCVAALVGIPPPFL